MSNTIVITSIYEPFWGTEEFMKSAQRVGLPVHNTWGGGKFSGHGNTMQYIYNSLKLLKDQYKYAIYADGADSFFVKAFTPPDGKMIYSTEKACYPHTYMQEMYKDKQTKWCYLNGGGWCGEISLLIEYLEKYALKRYTAAVNGQHEAMLSYFEALEAGFPIELDQQCEIFQTGAFAEIIEFTIQENKQIINNITGTIPCLWHFNGRTDAQWLYNLYK